VQDLKVQWNACTNFLHGVVSCNSHGLHQNRMHIIMTSPWWGNFVGWTFWNIRPHNGFFDSPSKFLLPKDYYGLHHPLWCAKNSISKKNLR
jgi:hypothetical protein